MVKYTITKFTARNVANLRDITFETDGDVIITGQNGAGKSTIKKALMWVLCGTTSDGEKLINPNFNALPFVEITLSDGSTSVKFGKEITQKADEKTGKLSRSTEHYFNGLPAKQKIFQTHFEQITPVYPVMIDLFGFGNLNDFLRRAVLLNTFSAVADTDVKATDEKFSDLNFNGMTPEQFKKSHAEEAKNLKARNKQISAQIESLQAQLADVNELDTRKVEVEKVLASYQAELEDIDAQLQARNSQANTLREVENERTTLTLKIGGAQLDKRHCEIKISNLEAELVRLRAEYKSVGKVCPTCGQPINGEKTAQLQAAICNKGFLTKNELEEYQDKLDGAETVLADLQKKLDDAKIGVDDARLLADINALIDKRNTVSGKISDCQKELAGINSAVNYNTKLQKSIADLRSKHKKIGGDISKHEYLSDLAGKFIQRKMDLVTSEINSNFEYVGFKMFETLKSGEVKQVCDATLNGVSYDNLSKGEKLFASLDILNAFQNCYGVMLPLIIDDAESYTSNTLGNVPNQKILFKVVEGANLEVDCNV